MWFLFAVVISIPDSFPIKKMFQGKQMHSHDYRNPEAFKDETILVIGGNFSAVHIVQQTVRFAKSVTWSHHLKKSRMWEDSVRMLSRNQT